VYNILTKKKEKDFYVYIGDTVLWANTRLLHARTAYRDEVSVGCARRRLIGCYFSWDVVKSRVRWLRDQLVHPENQQSI
jgi:alpha-ketoglutarate-dependent taurine dioxygenase